MEKYQRDGPYTLNNYLKISDHLTFNDKARLVHVEKMSFGATVKKFIYIKT